MNEEELFLQALQKTSPDERKQFLDEACAGNSSLHEAVDQLLRAHEKAGEFLERGHQMEVTELRPVTEKVGDTIGPYKLLQQIGEGGMGTIFMAEQTEPVERRVALKIIKPGMDTQQVIARFEAERQALAMMDHPNIAKVHDAGKTDTGRPYFVMELVKGVPITNYCDEQHLTPKERLELFIPICQAVQHAHQKGIIHRDLKPSNILVAQYDGKPVPKVIDFGVAKAISQKLTEKTMFTHYGQIVGTVEYMSPEQAQFNQLDVDTRSDVYSLGVLLYELLTGETPFDKERLRSAAFDELLRIIRDEEPPKPSTKLSSSQSLPTIAANRHIEPQKLSTLVRGELDWIVMKALEKDRNRRYETPNQFAEDVQHYLNDEAVSACPPSAAYRFRKFARRNKTVIATTAAIAVSLFVGIIGTSWQAYRATLAERDAVKFARDAEDQSERAKTSEKKAIAEAKRASREKAVAEAVLEFLNVDLLEEASPNHSPNRDVRLREILDLAATKIDSEFESQPAVEAAIRDTVGRIYHSLGEYEKAQEQLERARDLRERFSGPNHYSTLETKVNLASNLIAMGQYLVAEHSCRELLRQARATLGPDERLTLGIQYTLSLSLFHRAQYPEAEELAREVLGSRRRILSDNDPDTLQSISSVACILSARGKSDEARELEEELLTTQRQILGTEHPDTLLTMQNLASTLSELGKLSEALALLRETLEIQRRVLGLHHLQTVLTANSLANALIRASQHAEAERIYRESLAICLSQHGVEHPYTLMSQQNLAFAIAAQGRNAEAEALLRKTIEVQQKALGSEHPDVLLSLHNLATIHLDQGRIEQAEQLIQKVIEDRVRILGAEHPETLRSMGVLSNVYYAQDRLTDAEELYQETLKLRRRSVGNEHPDTLLCLKNLGNLYRRQERFDDAEQLHRQKLEIEQRTLGSEHPDTLQSMLNLGTTLEYKGDRQAAIRIFQDVVKIDPNDVYAFRKLGYSQEKSGDQKAAARAYKQALQLDDTDQWTWDALARVARSEGDHEAVIETFSELIDGGLFDVSAYRHRSKAYQQLGRFAEGITDLRHVVQLLRDSLAKTDAPVQTRESLGRALRDLGYALNKNGQASEAESAYREGLEVWQKLAKEFPDKRKYANRLGDVYRQLGHILNHREECGKALTCFERALEAAPDDHWSHHALASFRLYARDLSFRDPEQAARHATRAMELNPKYAMNHRHLGEARYRLEDWSGAVESLEKAIELGHALDAQIGFELAICCGHLNNREKGAEWYDQAVTLMEKQTNPDDGLVKLQDQAKKQLETPTPQTVKN